MARLYRKIIATMSAALRGSMDPMVDANSCYSPKRAIEVGQLLQDNGIGRYEEPCPYWELAQSREVADTLSINVSGGEQDCDLNRWREIIEQRVVDICQPDALYLGRVQRTLQVAQFAKAAALSVTPYCANFVTGHALHCSRAQSPAQRRKLP